MNRGLLKQIQYVNINYRLGLIKVEKDRTNLPEKGQPKRASMSYKEKTGSVELALILGP